MAGSRSVGDQFLGFQLSRIVMGGASSTTELMRNRCPSLDCRVTTEGCQDYIGRPAYTCAISRCGLQENPLARPGYRGASVAWPW